MVELHHKVLGQGAPIIILHGLFGTLDNWQTVGKALSEHYTVYLMDQRDHGRSPHTQAINYTLMAEDLRHFMESNWIFKAHIMGHSMGGKTAMQFALHNPDMVDQLVVVDIAPKNYTGGHESIFDAILALDLNTIESRAEAAVFLQSKLNDNGVVQFLMKNLTRSKEGKYEWKMNLPVIHQNYAAILSNVDAQQSFEGNTLFIRGADSNYIQDGDWQLILQKFPNASLATIPNAGHWVHADQPAQLLQTVQQFLK